MRDICTSKHSRSKNKTFTKKFQPICLRLRGVNCGQLYEQEIFILEGPSPQPC